MPQTLSVRMVGTDSEDQQEDAILPVPPHCLSRTSQVEQHYVCGVCKWTGAMDEGSGQKALLVLSLPTYLT